MAIDDGSIVNTKIPSTDLVRRTYYKEGEPVYVRTISGDENGVISSANSTIALLGIGETFTGEYENVLPYGVVYVRVKSDQDSATDGLVIESGHTEDGGLTFHLIQDDKFSIFANIPKTFSINPGEYLRVKYTNGGVQQTDFHINCIYKVGYALPSSHRINDSIVAEDDAQLIKAVLSGENPAGNFVNFKATTQGNFKVSFEELESGVSVNSNTQLKVTNFDSSGNEIGRENGLEISRGNVPGMTYVHKFGNAPDFDTTDGEVTIWDGANDAGINRMTYIYSTTADIDSMSSTSAGDTQNIEIQGLDANYDLVTQTVALTGQTRKAITPLLRIFRAKNVGATNLAGRVFIYVNTAIVTGTPTDTTQIRLKIGIGNNQTEMALYTIPNGTKGYIRSLYASSAGASRATNYIVKLKARPFGQVFQLKHRTAILDGVPWVHQYEEPAQYAAKTDLELTGQITESGIIAASLSAGFNMVLIDD